MRKQPLYGMDTGWFHHPTGGYPLRTRLEMIREAGFDLAHFTMLPLTNARIAETQSLRHATAEAGINLAGVWSLWDIDGREPGVSDDDLRRLFEGAAGTDAVVEISVFRGDHAAVVDRLGALVGEAHDHGLSVAIYPHEGFSVETATQAVAVAEQIDAKVIWNSYHWLTTSVRLGATDLAGSLREDIAVALPRMAHATLTGAAWSGREKPIHLTLDDGELDVFRVLAELDRAGWVGPVGVQHVGLGGDILAKMTRNVRTYDALTARLEAYPDWR